MIARGLRSVLLGVLGLAAVTVGAALLVGAAAGLPGLRAVSGGFLLVGSLVFVAGAAMGLRYPSRRAPDRLRSEPGDPRSQADATAVAGLLVGTGLALVLVGVALDPDTSL